MTLNSVSTLSLSTNLLSSIQRTQTDLSRATIESSTGQYADLGQQLGQQSGFELSLRNQVSLLQTLTSSNGLTAANLTSTQDALTSLNSTAQDTLNSLTTWLNGTNSGSIPQNLGQSALQSLTSVVNTSSNGQYLFGGINSGVAPLNDYFSSTSSGPQAAVAQAFQTTFGVSPTDPAASSISASAIQSFLTGPFANLFQGSSWSQWSNASSTNVTSEISPGQTIEASTNANQTGIQQLTQAYAMLTAFAGTNLSQSAQQAIVTQASSLINEGQSSLTTTQGILGGAQQSVTAANTMMGTQLSTIQSQIGDMDDVDASQVATQISELTTQLQASYQLTAQLTKMTLAQYLPT